MEFSDSEDEDDSIGIAGSMSFNFSSACNFLLFN